MNDIIIRGGLVLDGTGAPGFRADVGIKDGVIAEIGDLRNQAAERVLEAEGFAVAPGFIDSHAHSDTSFLEDDSCASKVYQGITTEITGQCGDSPFPAPKENPRQCGSFERFTDRFKQNNCRMAVNQAIMCGHGSLRETVMGCGDRAATEKELEEMKALLRSELESGAWGLSLGLEYAPGFFANADELSALAEVAGAHDCPVTCHMRNEGLHIMEAIDELAGIGRASGAHVHISHLKLDHYSVHGQAERIWAHIEKLRHEGIRLTADMYPYTASATGLSIRCPKWSKDGGTEALLAFLKGPRRREVEEGIRTHYFNALRAETCLFSDDAGLWPQIVGKTLRFVAEEYLHTTDYAWAAAEVLLRTEGRASCIFFVMDEGDMLTFLSKDVGIGSDGYALPGDPVKVGYRPHPRSYGAVAEFFRLAREHQICPVEEAVRRVTSKPAELIGLSDRGRLKPGMAADITVFDPSTIAPRAAYLEPVRTAVGVRHVLVNGSIALENGIQTEVRAGHFLKKTKAFLKK